MAGTGMQGRSRRREHANTRQPLRLPLQRSRLLLRMGQHASFKRDGTLSPQAAPSTSPTSSNTTELAGSRWQPAICPAFLHLVLCLCRAVLYLKAQHEGRLLQVVSTRRAHRLRPSRGRRAMIPLLSVAALVPDSTMKSTTCLCVAYLQLEVRWRKLLCCHACSFRRSGRGHSTSSQAHILQP